MAGTSTPKSDSFHMPESNDRFAFSSRPFGLALLGVLGITWVLNLLWIVYLLQQPGIAIRDESLADNISFGLDGARLALLLVSIALFLLWIFKIHQDFRRLSPNYSISPRSATIQIAIPLYGIVGLSNVYSKMSDDMVPDFDIWARIVPGTYAVMFLGTFLELDLPEWAYQTLVLGVSTIWLASTRVVHRTLGSRTEELLVLPNRPIAMNIEDPLLGQDTTASITSAFEITSLENGQRPAEPKKRNKGKWVAIGLGIALLAACIVAFGALMVPFFLETGRTTDEMNLYDENFDHLAAELDKRWGPDDSIPSASVDFVFWQSQGEEIEVWLKVQLETTEACPTGASNRCNQLVDEFATIALTEYSRIDEMDGLQVSVTHTEGNGEVTVETGSDQSFSIDEWRQRLGIPTK